MSIAKQLQDLAIIEILQGIETDRVESVQYQILAVIEAQGDIDRLDQP